MSGPKKKIRSGVEGKTLRLQNIHKLHYFDTKQLGFQHMN